MTTDTDSTVTTTAGRPTDQVRDHGTAIDRRGGAAKLASDRGMTSIADIVVAKIATLATQEIPGVQALGGSLSRTFGSIRSKIPGATSTSTAGVSVEVGERQAAVDIDVIVNYGHSVVEVADAIRSNVIGQVEGMTGLQVVEVNVSVDDLFVDGDESATEPRVA